jgi:hypothetical protein
VKAIARLMLYAVGVSVACSGGKDPRATRGESASSAAEREVVAHPLPTPQVTLVDSADDGEPGDIAFPLYRAQVTIDGRTDTIPGVRTHVMPVVGSDGRVYLFGYESGGFLRDGYIYDPGTRAITTLPTPTGAGALESNMSISPDARHIAYVSSECATAGGCGVVRSWPDGELIAETPGQPWCEGDFVYNDVRWLDINRAEIVYCSQHRFWVHAMVTVKPRFVQLDTLTSMPHWKR